MKSKGRISLGVLFGGRSVEHEVSILTGYQALAAVDSGLYEVHPVYLDRENCWFIGDALNSLDFFRRESPDMSQLTRVYPCPEPTRGRLRLTAVVSSMFRAARAVELECVLPATHGTFVEDGALQGILEMSGVAVAGSGVRASAVGMDKELTKAVLAAAGLPCLPFKVIHRGRWADASSDEIAALEGRFAYPMVVKPAVLGSSVAVTRAENRLSLQSAVELALRFCDRALVEPWLTDASEINCSVLDGDPPLPSVLEQPVSGAGLLTFDEKYRASGNTKGTKAKGGMAGQRRIIPAPLDEAMTERIQRAAVDTFLVVGAGGVARVDFLVSAQGEMFVNELNNIPGSLSFYLWEHMGRSFRELIDRMVQRAFEVQRRRQRTTYAFEANLLAGRGAKP